MLTLMNISSYQTKFYYFHRMKFLLAITASFLMCTGAFAQMGAEQFQSALIPSKFGGRVLFTSRKHALTLDVVSKDIKATENPGVILVNDQVLQYHLIPPTTVDTAARTTEQQRTLLLKYMKGEMDYVKKQMKAENMVTGTEWLTINNKTFLLWNYNVDKENKTNVLKQYYLCAVTFNQVLTLNSPVMKGNNEEAVKALLLQVGRTLMQFDTSINADAMYKALQN